MFGRKNKKDIFDDEIVIGKIKKNQKKRGKAKIKNEYFIDDNDTAKDDEIRDIVSKMLDNFEDFEPEIEVNQKKHLFDTEPKKFPFTKEDVFGKPDEVEEDLLHKIPVAISKKKKMGSLEKFFEADRKKLKKFKNKVKKPSKVRTKRKKRNQIDFSNIKEESFYKFGKRKFVKVEDFISFLTQNYLEIEDIAKLVLTDEKFHGWISKKSGIYSDAFKEFKDIKAKIEK